MKPLVIIGTGLAGYNVAKEFRKLNTEQELVLISHDDGCSYSKPMLSNALAKEKTPYSLVIADANKMSATLSAKIITHTHVTRIDTHAQQLYLDTGETQDYSQLVLAVGAQTIATPLSGDGVDGVFYVNNLQDYTTFHSNVSKAKHVAIIGPGLIGCEFANDLVSQDKAVTVIGPDSAPLGRLLPDTAGEFLQQHLSSAGVAWQLQTTVESINKLGDQYQLSLSNGEMLEVDLVLSAIGLKPDISLAEAAGLIVDHGVVVDTYLRSSVKNIYALGDCAQVAGHVLPFIMPIMHCSRALAKTLAGDESAVSYPAMPVLVKTPACATVIAPPAREAQGEWQVEATTSGVTAKFLNSQADLLGFALLGDAVQHKQQLSKVLPDVLV